MAKKGNRVQVILECTEHKSSGLAGTSRYVTTKNKKNTPDRIELKKFNLKNYKKLTHHIVTYCGKVVKNQNPICWGTRREAGGTFFK